MGKPAKPSSDGSRTWFNSPKQSQNPPRMKPRRPEFAAPLRNIRLKIGPPHIHRLTPPCAKPSRNFSNAVKRSQQSNTIINIMRQQIHNSWDSAPEPYVSPDLKPIPMVIGVPGTPVTAATEGKTMPNGPIPVGPNQQSSPMMPKSFAPAAESVGNRMLRAWADGTVPHPAARLGIGHVCIINGQAVSGRTVE